MNRFSCRPLALCRVIYRPCKSPAHSISERILSNPTTGSVYQSSQKSDQALVKSDYGHLMDIAKKSTEEEPREKYAEALMTFKKREKDRRGHVKFITFALHQLEEFGLQDDLLTYNRLIDIFPRDRFKPKNIFDAFWPVQHPQIDVALNILQKMEENGVVPNQMTYDLLVEIFGRVSFPVQKCFRLAFWFKMFENADPYNILYLPESPLELSRLALFRIAGDNGVINEVKVRSNDIDDNDDFVMSASTQEQIDLLKSLENLKDRVLHIEGPHRLWLKKTPVHYFSLTLLNNVTEDDNESREGNVLAVCMCSHPSMEDLYTWFHNLQQDYPALKDAAAVYNVFLDQDSDTDSARLSDCVNATQPLIS